MSNERLRNAMIVAHMDIDTIARVIGVDPKTVQRWLNGRVPHPRHRWKIAETLREREEFLWPADNDDVTMNDQTSEIITAYAHRSDMPPSAWWQLFLQAEKQIDLLGIALLFLPEQHPHLIELLKMKVSRSCKIRIALANPLSDTVRMRDEEEQTGTLAPRISTTLYHFRDILDFEGIQIRYHSTVLYNSYARFDDEMFVMPQLYKLHGSKAPLLHLRCLGPQGIFVNFAEHFEKVWETTIPLT
jgi:transcriptional regulator with XRE-family HTH domain